jgi:alkanesulfonate monooxygenase SsuD/methylene tetrahydromethanopterin reductase-like flavin-dependent oxidoreductase (luciferase family)
MIEGQEGVSWDEWAALGRACEQHGFDALFRSDHYLSVDRRPERGSLDAWTTLGALAAVTSSLRLGTLVSPVTFRHPSVLARSAVTVDHVSGGRVEVGVGAGWFEAEHEAFGFPFPPTRTRMDMLASQLEVLHREWSAEDPHARPKPVQQPRPPIIVGGSAGPRGAALAARWADEYNTVYATAEQCRERRERVAQACEREGREPLRFSLMTGFLIGADRAELLDRARRLAEWQGSDSSPEEHLASLDESWIVGTVDEALAQLRELEEAGVDRVMLQHHLYTDFESLALVGEELIRPLRGSP